MKLLAVTNGKKVVFSVGHYDCRAVDGLMADGGQPGCTDYAGYTRFSHKPIWIELPGVNFGTLFGDYQAGKDRAYGIHDISEVRILPEDEIPDTESREWKIENTIWGTRGPKGDQPLKWILLKDADTDHLKAILKNCSYAAEDIKDAAIEILERRAKQS